MGQYFEEILTEMEKILWVRKKDKITLSTKLCAGLFYNTPLNSEWFKVNFIRDLNEEINFNSKTY